MFLFSTVSFVSAFLPSASSIVEVFDSLCTALSLKPSVYDSFDHNSLHLELSHPSLPSQKPCRKPRLIWRYAHAGGLFDNAKAMIETTDWDSLITEDINMCH